MLKRREIVCWLLRSGLPLRLERHRLKGGGILGLELRHSQLAAYAAGCARPGPKPARIGIIGRGWRRACLLFCHRGSASAGSTHGRGCIPWAGLFDLHLGCRCLRFNIRQIMR